jgi:hypothetical protein
MQSALAAETKEPVVPMVRGYTIREEWWTLEYERMVHTATGGTAQPRLAGGAVAAQGASRQRERRGAGAVPAAGRGGAGARPAPGGQQGGAGAAAGGANGDSCPPRGAPVTAGGGSGRGGGNDGASTLYGV